jgi:transposase
MRSTAARHVAKLKVDARNLVGVIGGDKAKTQAYCQILDLMAQLDREKDSKKAKALSQKIDQLQKQLGPEFLALVNGLKRVDLNSPDGRDILSIIKTLDQSCDV